MLAELPWAIQADPFARYLRLLSEHIASVIRAGERYALLLDGSALYSIAKEQRTMVRSWLRENKESIEACNIASAFIMPGIVHRAVFQTIFWMQPLQYDRKVFADRGEGEEWILAKVRKAGYSQAKIPDGSGGSFRSATL